jgi:serine/threonine protein kinase
MKWLSDGAVERLRQSAAAEGAPDLSGTRYRVAGWLGRGGMGAVYLAEDTALERRVALKVLDRPDPSGELAARMLREARILAQLEHPGIVPVHDVGRLAGGRVFYTMKYVEGRRLGEHLGANTLLADRLRIFLRITEAVAFAHARGVIHRDIKPDNVMVGPFGEVLVMDWGIAKVLRDPHAEAEAETVVSTAPPRGAPSETAHGSVLGTPGYMPPEQARGEVERLDARADVYALGAMLRFLVTGAAPGEAASPAGKPAPRPLAAVCAKAMAAEPERRYPSAAGLAADVSRYLDGLPVSAYKESLVERAARIASRHRVWIILLLTYLAVRVLLFFWPRV